MIDTLYSYLIFFMSALYKVYPYMAGLVIIITFVYDNKKLDVQLGSIAKFISLMVIIMFIKICIWNGRAVSANTYNIQMYRFLFVFLEDAFFAMIPFYLCKKINSKILKMGVWMFFSVSFGLGHIYQGLIAASITAIYPYFISNHFAKKTSFGTVMVCHFVYDCFSILIPKINNLLSFL